MVLVNGSPHHGNDHTVRQLQLIQRCSQREMTINRDTLEKVQSVRHMPGAQYSALALTSEASSVDHTHDHLGMNACSPTVQAQAGSHDTLQRRWTTACWSRSSIELSKRMH